MNYELAGEVIEWLKEPSGECDRDALFKVLNACRERFYLMHEQIPLFDITMCFEVQTFCADCSTCHESYRGVTLPRDFQNVEALWYGDVAVDLFTSWREWQRGMTPECACGLGKYDLPQSYGSERDPLLHRPSPLKITADNPQDFGKTVMVRFYDFGGAARAETVVLQDGGASTTLPARALQTGGGFSKPRTAGNVVLGTEDGRILSVYAPDERVPSYKRIRIMGLPDRCAQVFVRGARKFFPVYRDEDVVETNNRVAFEEMARFLRINSKVSKNGDDVRAMGLHAQQAAAAMRGEKSREQGKSVNQSVVIKSASFGPHRLGGFRRW